MCSNCSDHGALSFEALLTDPMTRLVMDSDGVSLTDFIAVLVTASTAMDRHGQVANVGCRN